MNSNNLYFSLTLLDLSKKSISLDKDKEFAKVLIPQEKINSKYDLQILGYCYYKRRSVQEIATFLNMTPSTYFRKNILDYLIKGQYLIEFKEARNTKYIANKELVSLDD